MNSRSTSPVAASVADDEEAVGRPDGGEGPGEEAASSDGKKDDEDEQGSSSDVNIGRLTVLAAVADSAHEAQAKSPSEEKANDEASHSQGSPLEKTSAASRSREPRNEASTVESPPEAGPAPGPNTTTRVPDSRPDLQTKRALPKYPAKKPPSGLKDKKALAEYRHRCCCRSFSLELGPSCASIAASYGRLNDRFGRGRSCDFRVDLSGAFPEQVAKREAYLKSLALEEKDLTLDRVYVARHHFRPTELAVFEKNRQARNKPISRRVYLETQPPDLMLPSDEYYPGEHKTDGESMFWYIPNFSKKDVLSDLGRLQGNGAASARELKAAPDRKRPMSAERGASVNGKAPRLSNDGTAALIQQFQQRLEQLENRVAQLEDALHEKDILLAKKKDMELEALRDTKSNG